MLRILKKCTYILIMCMIILNLNTLISIATEFPITKKENIPMDLNIFNSTSNLWCIEGGAHLGRISYMFI